MGLTRVLRHNRGILVVLGLGLLAACSQRLDPQGAFSQASVLASGPVITLSQTQAPLTNVANFSISFSVSSANTLVQTQCTLDAQPAVACANSFTAPGLTDGPHTLVISATDSQNNNATQTISWVVDATPPVVSLNLEPSTITNQSAASFVFSAKDNLSGVAGIQCALDSNPYAPCISPENYSSLVAGMHTFKVEATDKAGNVSQEMTYSWKIDFSVPAVKIVTEPLPLNKQTSAKFSFSGADSSGTALSLFTCTLDSGSAQACNSGTMTYASLTEGSHQFSIIGKDSAGNFSAAATYSWIVDLTSPVVTLTSKPLNPTTIKNASFQFTATDKNGVQSTTCSLDSSTAVACASSMSYSNLPSGTHTFTVKALDNAGNAGSASYSWLISMPQPSPTPVPTSSPFPISGTQKSIKGFTTCDGITDDRVGATAAFAAAANNAFTLVVDCPVFIHFGNDISHPIFIDNGTSVVFSGAGKFIVDNLMIPGFVLANTTNVNLINWNVEYTSGLPINPDVGGYYNNGVFTAANGHVQPAGGINNYTLSKYYRGFRNVTFSEVTPIWCGGVVPMAIIYMTGDTSNVTVKGMNMYVAQSAGGDKFIPVAFGFSQNWKSNQSVTSKTPLNSTYVGVPHNITLSQITLDGTYMGFLGGMQNSTIDQIQSLRYGDLQDANGNNVGGLNKWFPPPHLFYISYNPDGDPTLFNRNIQMTNVTDSGVRVGTARDKGGTDTISGFALSLKIGGDQISVNNYTSKRPDGFMDVLESNGLSVSNVTATYSSTFLNNVFPGWRFPASPYADLTFTNISITDTGTNVIRQPIGPALDSKNSNIVFKNVTATVNDWVALQSSLPALFGGTGNNVAINYSILSTSAKITDVRNNTVGFTLEAAPATLKAGGTTVLTWTSASGGATSCTGSGAWTGTLGVSGTKSISIPTATTSNYVLTCKNGADTASGTIAVVTTP